MRVWIPVRALHSASRLCLSAAKAAWLRARNASYQCIFWRRWKFSVVVNWYNDHIRMLLHYDTGHFLKKLGGGSGISGSVDFWDGLLVWGENCVRLVCVDVDITKCKAFSLVNEINCQYHVKTPFLRLSTFGSCIASAFSLAYIVCRIFQKK